MRPEVSTDRGRRVTHPVRSRLRRHRQLPRLDARRVRLLRARLRRPVGRGRLRQDHPRHRAGDFGHARLSSGRRVHLRPDGGSLRPPAAADDRSGVLLDRRSASGFAPNYTTFLMLRALFGIGMGGEWGVGASLAMEKGAAAMARPALGAAAGGIRDGLSARRLCATSSSSRTSAGGRCSSSAARPRCSRLRAAEGEGVGGLGEEQARRLVPARTQHRRPLEAVSVPRAADDDDEFRLARHAGHVSDVPAEAARLHAARSGGDRHDLQRRRDRRRPGHWATTPIASAGGARW